MNILLDTFILYNWQESTLSSREIEYLNRLFFTLHYNLVLTSTHIWEFGGRAEQVDVVGVSRFLDTIPNKVYIANPEEIELIEVLEAYSTFCNQTFNKHTMFVKNWVHTLAVNSLPPPRMRDDLNEFFPFTLLNNLKDASCEECMLELSNHAEYKKFKETVSPKLSQWGIEMNHRAKELNGEQWKCEVKASLMRKLGGIVQQLKSQGFLAESKIDSEFISFMVDNPDLIPGIKIPLFVQHEMHRHSHRFETNDIGDLSLLPYASYVDYMIVDRNKYNLVNQVLRRANNNLERGLSKTINKTVIELSDKLIIEETT